MPPQLQRFGWCWDHSTNWTPAVHGRQTFGTNQPYLKRPEVFLSDFKLLLDFLARKNFAGLCVWGLIRDSHGGLQAAREIVQYGRDRSVSVTPGVGLFAYGGAFYEGRHPFNAETFALAHPDCLATVSQTDLEPLRLTKLPDGTLAADLADPYIRRAHPWVQLCPSNPDVRSWVKDACSWVIEALDLDTIMLEGGDVFICRCPACSKRRKRAIDTYVSIEDLCDAYVPLVDYLHRHHPNVRVQCEVYGAPGIAPASSKAGNGDLIPSDCIPGLEAIPEPVQLELSYHFPIPEDRLNLPHTLARNGLLRTEMGTQWRGPRSHSNADGFRLMCRAARKLGIPAVSLFVEEPDSTPAAWINYLAFESFSKEDISLDQFIDRDLAPHLGGPDRARDFLPWASNPKHAPAPQGLTLAKSAASSSRDESEFLKWAWLSRFIAEYGS
ncbi:MAG: hypothetical protein V2A58_15400 [Planctomycetota bacterium]